MTKYNILYIEDNAFNRTLMQRLLGLVGYEVHLAETGQEGLTRAAELVPDLLLIDMHLPDVSGYEVIERLSQVPEIRDIPRVIFSAERVQPRNTLPAGPNFFIQKAEGVPTLIEKIKYLIEHSHNRTQFELCNLIENGV